MYLAKLSLCVLACWRILGLGWNCVFDGFGRFSLETHGIVLYWNQFNLGRPIVYMATSKVPKILIEVYINVHDDKNIIMIDI